MNDQIPAAPSSVDEAVESQPARKHGLLVFLRDLAVILLAAVRISFLIKTFLLRSFYIPSASMENTLQINDRIMVNQLVPKAFPLSRGDVVVFTDPGGWLSGEAQAEQNQAPLQQFFEGALSIVGLTAPDSNDHLVKRVIGLPGDHVSCCNAQGQVVVNGIGITEPYILLPAGQTRASSVDFDVVVPEGELFVMGDNRYNSRDSRYQTSTPLKGFVPMSSVVGHAFVITWPINRWTWLGNYPETFSSVPKPSVTTSGR